jgi:chaperonin GroES
MKLKPLQDWALIQRIEPEEMTAAGIIIPEVAKDKPTEGIVLAIGPGKFKAEKGEEKKKEKKKFVPTVLKPGQRIIYGKYSAREFELDGETIVLVREEDVLGTVEETPLAQKRSFAIEEKYEKPVAVKKGAQVMNVAPPAQKKSETPSPEKKKPLIKKAAIKKKTVSKAAEKPAKKKSPQTKKVKTETPKVVSKTVKKKAVAKKPAAKKTAPKPLKKTTPPKKVKAAGKKVAVKKTAVKKSVQKKTVVPKKKTAQKKTTVKISKKTVRTIAVVKKKQTAKKPLAKGKAKTKK